MRRHQRLGEMTFRRDEITQIDEYPETGLLVKTADRATTIYIPMGIDSYEAVRTQLATWVPFTTKAGPLGLIGRYALMLSVVAFLFALLFVRQRARHHTGWCKHGRPDAVVALPHAAAEVPARLVSGLHAPGLRDAGACGDDTGDARDRDVGVLCQAAHLE